MLSQFEESTYKAVIRIPGLLERIANALDKQSLEKPEDNEPHAKWKGWISVNDALPPYRLRVIVMVPEHGENRMYKSFRAEENSADARGQVIDPNHFIVHGEGLKVAYWMYIPVLPNGGK